MNYRAYANGPHWEEDDESAAIVFNTQPEKHEEIKPAELTAKQQAIKKEIEEKGSANPTKQPHAFKIGDDVRIGSWEDVQKVQPHQCTPEMQKHCGKVYKITYVYRTENAVQIIDENKKYYYYESKLLTPITDENEEKPQEAISESGLYDINEISDIIFEGIRDGHTAKQVAREIIFYIEQCNMCNRSES